MSRGSLSINMAWYSLIQKLCRLYTCHVRNKTRYKTSVSCRTIHFVPIVRCVNGTHDCVLPVEWIPRQVQGVQRASSHQCMTILHEINAQRGQCIECGHCMGYYTRSLHEIAWVITRGHCMRLHGSLHKVIAWDCMGHYTRSLHEIAWVITRGHCMRLHGSLHEVIAWDCMGHYTRSLHEIAWVITRGHCMRLHGSLHEVIAWYCMGHYTRSLHDIAWVITRGHCMRLHGSLHEVIAWDCMGHYTRSLHESAWGDWGHCMDEFNGLRFYINV